jgi:N-acyl homoserine lactone hydrolase
MTASAPVTITTASGVRVHGVQTGTLSIKAAHRALHGPAALRFPAILLDRRWTEPLPLLVWVIEHPEGLIVVDTGELAGASTPADYLESEPGLRWFVAPNFRIRVGTQEEIGPQLRALGLDPNDVRWLVQTHLHFDHTGGLGFFPRSEVLVSRLEFDKPPNGAAPSLWPSWYRPTLVEARNESFGPFRTSYVLTSAGDVRLIPTPGHTNGHTAVVLEDDERTYFFAGDAAFSEAQLLRGEVAGINQDVAATKNTLGHIRELARRQPVVFLPTHDPRSLARLGAKQTVAGYSI